MNELNAKPELGSIIVIKADGSESAASYANAPASHSPEALLRKWLYDLPTTNRPLFDLKVGKDPDPAKVSAFVAEGAEEGKPAMVVYSFPDYLYKPDKKRVWHEPYFDPAAPLESLVEKFNRIVAHFPGRVQCVSRQAWDRRKGEALKNFYEAAGFACEETLRWIEMPPEIWLNMEVDIDDNLTFEVVDDKQQELIDSLSNQTFQNWTAFYRREGHTPQSIVAGVGKDGDKVVGMHWALLTDGCKDEMYDGYENWRQKLGPKTAFFRSLLVDPEYRGARIFDRIDIALMKHLVEKLGIVNTATETSSLNKATLAVAARHNRPADYITKYNMFKRDDSV